MKMEHYLSHTDYPIWQVIHNGNGLVSVTTYTNGMIKVLPPKTAEEVVARERERKARTTLLMALPEDHFAKFHKMVDAKDMFQTLLSQLEIHGAGVSHEDVNQKFLSTNDVSAAYSVSSPSVSKSQKEGSSSYTDEVIHSFFANQSTAPQLDYNDLEQINDDMEEMDLKWHVAMISMRIKKFHKRTKRNLQFDTKDPVGFDKTKVKCFNCHKIGHFARDCRAKGNQDSRRRDVGYNENKTTDNGKRHAYQDDSKALVTIDEEDIDYRLLNTQMSDNDKFGLGYGDYRYGSNLSYENEVLQRVFMNKASDLEDTPINDRYADGMHAVPPLIIGNYMPSRPDVEIDYSKFTYGPKQTSADESDSKPSEYASCESNSSVDTSTSMPEPVKNASKFEPKVWTDAPIIEEYESDSDNDSVSNVKEDKKNLVLLSLILLSM
nr:hypothetical protein [Tanacetum cinerariifolium]